MTTSACSQLAAVAALNGLTALLNAVSDNYTTIKIFTGPVPANTEAPDMGTLLSAGLTCSATAFAPAAPTDGPPRGAVAIANVVANDTNAAAAGRAGYWRAYAADGSCVLQGTCGIGGSAAMILNNLNITARATVECTSWQIVLPDGS